MKKYIVEEYVPDYRAIPMISSMRCAIFYFPSFAFLCSWILIGVDGYSLFSAIVWGTLISLIINALCVCANFVSHFIFIDKEIALSFYVTQRKLIVKKGNKVLNIKIDNCSWKIGYSRECHNFMKSGKKRLIVISIPVLLYSRNSFFLKIFKNISCKIGCGLNKEKFKEWEYYLRESIGEPILR